MSLLGGVKSSIGIGILAMHHNAAIQKTFFLGLLRRPASRTPRNDIGAFASRIGGLKPTLLFAFSFLL